MLRLMPSPQRGGNPRWVRFWVRQQPPQSKIFDEAMRHRRQLLVNLSSRVKPRRGLCYRSVSTTFSEGPRCGCHKRTGEDSDERASKGGVAGGGERQGR